MSQELEAAIAAIGRDKVHGLMRAAGWSGGDNPPHWCWWLAVNACRDTESRNAQPIQPNNDETENK